MYVVYTNPVVIVYTRYILYKRIKENIRIHLRQVVNLVF